MSCRPTTNSFAARTHFRSHFETGRSADQGPSFEITPLFGGAFTLGSEGVRRQRGGHALLSAQYLLLMPARERRGVGAIGNAELAEQRSDMVLDRALRAMQSIGDRAIRKLLRQQIQHFAFARGQAERVICACGCCARVARHAHRARAAACARWPPQARRRVHRAARARRADRPHRRRATPAPARSGSRARPRPAPHGAWSPASSNRHGAGRACPMGGSSPPARFSQHASCPMRQRSPLIAAASNAAVAISRTCAYAPRSHAASQRATACGAYQGSTLSAIRPSINSPQYAHERSRPRRRSSRACTWVACSRSSPVSDAVCRTAVISASAASHCPHSSSA